VVGHIIQKVTEEEVVPQGKIGAEDITENTAEAIVLKAGETTMTNTVERTVKEATALTLEKGIVTEATVLTADEITTIERTVMSTIHHIENMKQVHHAEIEVHVTNQSLQRSNKI